MAYEMLLSPIKIGNMQLKNRVVMAPMLIGMGDFDGKPTEQLMNYYVERAKGGTALIITEITRVNDFHGAAAFAQLSMSKDSHIEPMRKFADRIHEAGGKLAVQLHHPGRQNLGLCIGTIPLLIPFQNIKCVKKLIFKVVPKVGPKLLEKHWCPKVYAPSVTERAKFADSKMKAFSHKQIVNLEKDFIDAAERLQKAGVDAVELHASHGYLIQQFLSPYTNRRTDEYGGSLENRMRFLLNIIKGIKERCPGYPVLVRLTVDECYSYIGKPGVGYDLKEGVEMAKRLEAAGVDAIDVSSAGYDTFNYWLEPTSFPVGWRKYMAAEVKKNVKIPVLAANLIRTPEQAERQLEEGTQDLISLGRPHIADPYFVNKCASGHPEDIRRCICCLYCIQSMEEQAFHGSHTLCSLNPYLGHEGEMDKITEKVGNGRLVVIVGAGVAGLMCAEVLLRRGFNVTIVEKEAVAGGQLNLADKGPGKDKIAWATEDLMTSVTKLGVNIKFNTEATVEMLKEMNPYAVVIATGGVAIKPKSIKGIDNDNVCTSTEILSGAVKLENKQVVVAGSGMTGLETSEYLCKDGNHVTVVEGKNQIAPGMWFQHVDDAMQKLSKYDTRFVTGKMLVEINEKGVVVEDTKTKNRSEIPCDNVVISLGVRSDNKLYKDAKDMFERIYVIGDADKTGRIASATKEAFETALKIK